MFFWSTPLISVEINDVQLPFSLCFIQSLCLSVVEFIWKIRKKIPYDKIWLKAQLNCCWHSPWFHRAPKPVSLIPENPDTDAPAADRFRYTAIVRAISAIRHRIKPKADDWTRRSSRRTPHRCPWLTNALLTFTNNFFALNILLNDDVWVDDVRLMSPRHQMIIIDD